MISVGSANELIMRIFASNSIFKWLKLLTLGIIVYLSLVFIFAETNDLPSVLPDFAAFYTAGTLTLQGYPGASYRPIFFFYKIWAVTGVPTISPWAYPPQAFPLLAVFSIFPFGISYFIFTSASFLLFL